MFNLHSFIPLFKFFFSSLFLRFAAGADVLGAAAAAEVPLTEGGEEGAGVAEPTEDGKAAGAEPAEGEVDPAKAAAARRPEPEMVRPLSPVAKAALKQLKSDNPDGWKELNAKLWGMNAQDKQLAEAFPEGGLKQAVEIKSQVENLLTQTNSETLQEVSEEIAGFRRLDGQIEKADISFFREMPENMQAGVLKMLPQFMNEWVSRDKEGYDRYFGGVLLNTLRESRFEYNLEQALERLEDMGLDDAQVKRIHGILTGNLTWIRGLSEKLSKAPVKTEPAEQETQLSDREKAVQQEELKMARARVGNRLAPQLNPKMLGILKQIAGGKIPDHVNSREVFIRALKNAGAKHLSGSIDQRIGQYFAGKDEDGALKYILQQLTDSRLTDAVTESYNYLYPKSAIGGVKNKDDKGAGGEPPPKPVPGFTRITYNPRPSSIDLKLTDALAKEMGVTRAQLFGQDKCVLKGGKKVTWPHDAPHEE